MTENDSLTDIITTIKNKMLFRLSHVYHSHTHKRKIILILLYLVGMVEWLANAQSGAQQWSERWKYDDNELLRRWRGEGGQLLS